MEVWHASYNVVNWHFPGLSPTSIDHYASLGAPFCVILVSKPPSTIQGTRISSRLENCCLGVKLSRSAWRLPELHPGGLFSDNRLTSYIHTNFKLGYQTKCVHSKWSSGTSVGFLHMSGWVPGHPGMLRGPLFAFSAHTGLMIKVHLELFENASSHLLRFSYSSQGQLGSPQPGCVNRRSPLLLPLSDEPGKVYIQQSCGTKHWITSGKVAEFWTLRGSDKVWNVCESVNSAGECTKLALGHRR